MVAFITCQLLQLSMQDAIDILLGHVWLKHVKHAVKVPRECGLYVACD